MVVKAIIKFIAGVEISYLDTRHQILLNDTIDYNCCEVNAKQGTKIKKPKEKISINYTKLKEYFPKKYTPQQCEEVL